MCKVSDYLPPFSWNLCFQVPVTVWLWLLWLLFQTSMDENVNNSDLLIIVHICKFYLCIIPFQIQFVLLIKFWLHVNKIVEWNISQKFLSNSSETFDQDEIGCCIWIRNHSKLSNRIYYSITIFIFKSELIRRKYYVCMCFNIVQKKKNHFSVYFFLTVWL